MVSPLDKKLIRDLKRIKVQAVAIALVIALGVLMLVMMDGLVNTLDETRRAYYERYRLADVFAPVKRAPEQALNKLAQIPGVSSVQSRVIGDMLLDLPGTSVPLRARAISLPDSGIPRLNNLLLTHGRMPNTDHSDEVLLLKSFAQARKLAPGETLFATMNGARHRLHIVGLAQSPEFLYTTAPGEFVPDDGRFAVIWMSQTALSAAYDMQGAFNEALLSLNANTHLSAVTDSADRILQSYGAIGAYGLEDQISNRFLSEEISGLKASAVSVPPIFLAIAAFLLYIVISRIVQSEREQIGLLKAFGYSSYEVCRHYMKLIMIIAIGGSIAGSLMGITAGRSMAGFYQNYYKFPFIIFQLDSSAFITGLMVSIMAASLGGLLVLGGIFSLTPAVAMRPPAPLDYSHSNQLSSWIKNSLDQPSRMVLRRILRQPVRSAGAIIGIAASMALSVGMINTLAGFDLTLELTFSVLDRSDATVSFTHPVSNQAVYELERLDGVVYVEPFRTVPVIFRNQLVEYRGAIAGLVNNPRLNRALSPNQKPILLPGSGIILSKALADALQVTQGDLLTAQVREGHRPVIKIAVAGICETLLGAPSYMAIESLNRLLKEPKRISGAYLTLDKLDGKQAYKAIKKMPAVNGISLKRDSKDAFQKLIDTGAGSIRYIMALIAGIITFGIIYNTARIAYAERERDLASLRVIGFTKGEASFVLLGELALITLVALPIGSLLGYFLSQAISNGFSTDIYQIPSAFSTQSYGMVGIAVIIASLASGWLVKRDMDKVDLVHALKSRE